MVRFRQEVSIEPLSRRRLEDVVEAFHDAVEGLDFTGDRFVDPSGGAEIQTHRGTAHRHRHPLRTGLLRPGRQAPREVPGGGEAPSDLLITSGPRRGDGIQLMFGTDSYSATWTMKLCSAHRPRTLMTRFALKGNHRLVREITFLAEIDLEHWWQQLDGHGSGIPAATARVTHHLFTGTLEAVRITADDNRWGLAVTVAGRGRSWARPLAALTAFFSVPFYGVPSRKRSSVRHTPGTRPSWTSERNPPPRRPAGSSSTFSPRRPDYQDEQS